MVFREMDDALAQRNLRVERRVGLEAMLPVEPEAEKTRIKILGFGLVEDSQDGHTCAESHLIHSLEVFAINWALCRHNQGLLHRKMIAIGCGKAY